MKIYHWAGRRLFWALFFFATASTSNRDSSERKKFSSITNLAKSNPGDDAQLGCILNLEVLWSVDVGSPIFATPSIESDFLGNRNLIVPTVIHDVTSVSLQQGLVQHGWPVSFDGNHFHASPITHDIDGDGINDICVVSIEGHIFWLQMGEQGHYLQEYHVHIPALRVHKNWYEGLESNATDPFAGLAFFASIDGSPLNRNSTLGRTADADHGPLFARDSDAGKKRRLDTNENEKDIIDSNENGEESYGEWLSGFEDVYSSAYMGDDLMAGYWEAEKFGGSFNNFGTETDSEFINVDVHCLSSPVMADIDGDGNAEMIIAVSYFFDRQKYSNGVGLPPGTDPGNYVGGGLLAFDFALKDWVWMQHIDLTTDVVPRPAFIYASPTIADLDGNGRLEVIIGTCTGLVYAFDAAGGYILKGFPVQLGEIHAQIVVADMVEDEGLELVIGDMEGNIVLMKGDGSIVWRRQTGGKMSNSAVIGDVNGDGRLDIVAAINSPQGEGYIWVLDAETGQDVMLDGPIRIGVTGKLDEDSTIGGTSLSAAPLLVNLNQERVSSENRGLHIVVPSVDGHIYIINGRTRCIRRIDIGQMGEGAHMYSQVLATDIDGQLSLILSTMSGAITALGTGLPSDPYNLWESPIRGGLNGFVHGSHQGVFFLSYSKSWQPSLNVEFEILDYRWNEKSWKKVVGKDKYSVEILLGPKRRLAFKQGYSEPGRFVANLLVNMPTNTELHITMVTDSGLYFDHRMKVEHMTGISKYFELLMVAPLLVTTLILLIMFKYI